jgi:hypothetical protein
MPSTGSQAIVTSTREHHPRYRQPTLRKLYESIGGLKQWPLLAVLGARKQRESFYSCPCLTSPFTGYGRMSLKF